MKSRHPSPEKAPYGGDHRSTTTLTVPRDHGSGDAHSNNPRLRRSKSILTVQARTRAVVQGDVQAPALLRAHEKTRTREPRTGANREPPRAFH